MLNPTSDNNTLVNSVFLVLNWCELKWVSAKSALSRRNVIISLDQNRNL
jgi:hypothetical protein